MSIGFIKNKIRVTCNISVLCLLFGTIFLSKLNAQPVPVGDFKENQYRLLQLLSDSTTETSLMNRPLWLSTYNKLFENNAFDSETWWTKPASAPETTRSVLNYSFKIGAYEPVFKNTYNTNLPYGKNNGAAWYGRGYTNELQGGFFITSDYFTLTLRPHLYYTQNKDFAPPSFLPRYSNGDIRYVAPGMIPEDSLAERIDRPWRFGPDPYTTLDWGQSSVRLHYKSIEAGVSNETLWWGPGKQYALAMSNNAAGMLHSFIGTRSPISLPFNMGDLEFRWIFAWPQDSQYFDLNVYGNPSREERQQRLAILNAKRFMNGLNIVYSPSFLPNLSLGLSRIIHQYVPEEGLSVGNDILGVFKAFPKPDEGVLDGPRDDSHFEEKNPIASVFFRWVWPESNAEFYGELYKEDHNVNVRDFLMEPQHGRGYTLGIQKILAFDGTIDFVKVNAEINSLLPGQIDDVRPQTYYYTHSTVKQGHTNKGEVLGAAIGPGSESQYLGIDSYFNRGKVGISVQRVVTNNHFHYENQQRFFPGGGFKDQFHHQIDLNLGLNGTYQLSSILLQGGIVWNRNFNYGHDNLGKRSFYTLPVDIVDNFQYQLSIRYLF